MEETIRFRINKDDKEKIEMEAKELGISVSAFIRLLIRNWSNGIKFEKDKRGSS
uniref:Putative ribbon-helix-helix protein repressor n=1 Tax=viral metagenome TaxID=1070528 RepID=A0A6M3XT91_9ZZZZ